MPDPDTWEARMSRRAAERNRAVDERIDREGPPGHEGHHEHLYGTGIVCSCGELLGVICVAFETDDEGNIIWEPPTCSECGAEGVYMGPRRA